MRLSDGPLHAISRGKDSGKVHLLLSHAVHFYMSRERGGLGYNTELKKLQR